MTKPESKPRLEPLKITCTSSKCDEGLHCFLATKKMKMVNKQGQCRSCGVELVDWSRVHAQSVDDVDYTFSALRLELIRHYFWHVDIDLKAINHARRKGRIEMRAAVGKRIRSSVGGAEPTFDGRQTPREGNAIFYAQHATASCCRKCIEEWHGIPMGRDLDDAEITYLTELACRYIEERLPQLTDEGERVPPIRVSEKR